MSGAVGERGPELVTLLLPLCCAPLYRCCGEGTIRCEKPAGHYPGTPHCADNTEWG